MHTRRHAIVSVSSALVGTALRLHERAPVASLRLPPSPGPRTGHAMAYHAGTGAVCLVGGDREGTGDTREEPWFWNGRQWDKRATAGAPGVTSLVAAAADPQRRSVLTFGGFAVLGPRRYGPPAGDLWELEANSSWRRHDVEGLRPGPRHHHALVFDTTRRRLVMYGGIDAMDAWDVDVWEWDAEHWHRIRTETGPGERAHHAMAYDSKRERVVLRGGTRRDKVRPSDTWEWDGKVWRRAAGDGPGPGDGYRMAYDAERGATVLFGGDTCLWDGSSWVRVATPGGPSPRSVHAMAYDPHRKCVVLYGGSVNQERAADTWEWDGTAWRRSG